MVGLVAQRSPAKTLIFIVDILINLFNPKNTKILSLWINEI